MDQSEILEHAKSLGKRLADHPRVKAYAEAQKKLQADEQARRLLRDYQLLADKLQRLQAEGKKVADPDAAQLRKFEQDLATNDAVKAWMKAQSDYVELMFHIDRGIQQGLAEAMGRASGQQRYPQPGPGQTFVPRIVPGTDKAQA